MAKRDAIAAAVTDLEAESLEVAFAARVLKVARAELPPQEGTPAFARLSAGLRGALVPTLLSTAAVCRVGLTAKTAASVFAEESDD